MSASKPHWFRLDTGIFQHPKILAALEHGDHAAISLWIRGIAHSTEYLTDGYIAQSMPRIWGYRPRHTEALVIAELWHIPPLEGATGWLIHDMSHYQPTRTEWQAKSEKRQQAARRRWMES